MRRRFVERGSPRLVLLLILSLAGLGAFACSVVALRLGLEQMWLRYLLATVVGYGLFLLLIRLWIAFHRGDWRLDDIPDPSFGSGGGEGHSGFGGGGSGGGGASGDWSVGDAGLADVPDLDDAWPVALVIVALAGGALLLITTLFYVVNVAPVLFAEVALDAALISSVYRRLRKQDVRYWLDTAIRHTWQRAAVVAVLMSAAGYLAQWAVPTARTIGDVFRS